MIQRAEDAGADLVEVRLDYLRSGASDVRDEFGKVVKQASVPLIATNRQYAQGGFCPQDERQRVQTLIDAAEAGFRYVDVETTTAELKTTIKSLRDRGSDPIVSYHNFECTPKISEMRKITRTQIEAGAEICKLVTTANDIEDNVRCLLLTQRASKSTKIVCFAMGRLGGLSRAFSPLFGAYFTFASLESGLKTASGQTSIAKLRSIYSKLGIGNEDFRQD